MRKISLTPSLMVFLIFILPLIVYQSPALFYLAVLLFPIVFIFLRRIYSLKIASSNVGEYRITKNLFKYFYLTSVLIISTFLVLNLINLAPSGKLDWLMAVGWDLVGHVGLFWYSASQFQALTSDRAQQTAEVFHYLMGGYPQLWHFFTGISSHFIAEPYSLYSLEIFALIVQVTVVFSLILWVSSFVGIAIDFLLRNEPYLNYEEKKITVYILILPLLVILTAIAYAAFGPWTYPGWVNWPLAISLLVFGLKQYATVKHSSDFSSQKSQLVDSLLFVVLVMLYQSIFAAYILVISLQIILIIFAEKLSIKKAIGALGSLRIFFFVYSLIIFFYLSQQMGSIDFLTDGGGVRIRLRYYLLVLLFSFFILAFQILGKQFINRLISSVILAYIIFIIPFIFLTLQNGRQPYFFAKLASVFFFITLTFTIIYLYIVFLKIVVANYAFSLENFTSRTVPIKLCYALSGAGLSVCLIFLSTSDSLKNHPSSQFLLYYNLRASYDPKHVSIQQDYDGEDILKIDDMGFENRELKETAVFFAGDWPYLANMWISILRPNDAYRAWGPEADWFGDSPDRWTNYVNIFGYFASVETITRGLASDKQLILITANKDCPVIKTKLPDDSAQRLKCLKD